MDSNTFTSLFITLRDRLRTISWRYLENDDDVDDALQDMFIRLWNHSEKYKDESQATGAMVTSIKNISIDHIRGNNAHPHADISEADSVLTQDDNSTDETIKEIDSIIESTLTPQQQKILYQRDRDGWEYEDIAKYHNLSETNIRVILSRARKKVRDIYNKQYETH